MSIGASIDKAIGIGFGAYLIYLSHKKKEVLGNKARWMKSAGISLIVIQIILILIPFLLG